MQLKKGKQKKKEQKIDRRELDRWNKLLFFEKKKKERKKERKKEAEIQMYEQKNVVGKIL